MIQCIINTILHSKCQVLAEKPVSESLGSPQILLGMYLGWNLSLVFDRQMYKRPIFWTVKVNV